MIHDHQPTEAHEIEGTVDVTMDLKDWVWLCELLNEVKNAPDIDQMCKEDTERALSALSSFESAV